MTHRIDQHDANNPPPNPMNKENMPECICACHAVHRPYAHDTKCCDEMNGFVENMPESWEREFEKLWTIGSIGVQINFGHFSSAKQIEKAFITDLIAQERAKAVSEVLEIVNENIQVVTESFNGDGFVTKDMKSFALVGLKDVRNAIYARSRGEIINNEKKL